MRRAVSVLSFFLALTSLSAESAFGQGQEIGVPQDHVSWSTSSRPEVVAPGGRVHAFFQAEIGDAWKMYALDSSLPPTESVLSRPYGVAFEWNSLPDGVTYADETVQSSPEEKFDDIFGMTLKYFHDGARFAAAFDVSSEVEAGPHTIEAGVRYQICNDDLGICLNRVTVPVSITFEVDPSCGGEACSADPGALAALADGGVTTRGASGDFLLSAASDLATSRSGGFWAFLLLAVGAGLASLLTPCVFPMIPLTVSYFTKHADNRPQAFRMASVFGGSIVVTFTGVGVLAAVVVGAAGAQRIASNPWVNLFIAFVLVGFALALLGLYELRLPTGLLNYFNKRGNEGSGLVGVLFMGLTLTLVSFSCTAPFVGGLLAAASGGTWIYPLLGMIAYSATFALPFVLLAMFPNAISALPRSGSWMNVLKVVLGFVELAAAIKFFSNADLLWGWGLISRPLGIAFVLVVFALAGFYLLGRLRLAHEPPVETIGVGRMLGAVLFFVAALYMLPGLLGAPLNRLDAYLPPRQGTDVSILSLFPGAGSGASASNDEGWIVDDVDEAFVEGIRLKQPVFIDFSGYTCTNCREMEANVFPRPAVARRLKDFVRLRLYTDGLERGDDLSRFQLQMTGTVALPTYAVVDPGSRQVLARWSGMMDAEAFMAFLDTGASVHGSQSTP